MEADRGAAFFDLDRTLLSGASGEVLSKAMVEAGVTSRPIPGESILSKLFNTVGETLPSMVLARQAATFARGRSQAAMRRAGELAVDRLVGLVRPVATTVFAEHRGAGRPVVMATATPHDLVLPLARRLGLDDVIATRYGVREDGTYDGTIVGPFVWSAGKLATVRTWAAEHDVDLARSWAYSDSIYDAPLLAAVGNAVAVNPDPRLAVMAAARRWPVLDISEQPDAARAGLTRIPVVNAEIQRLALGFAHPMFLPFVRFDLDGTANIPSAGAAILVANHRSYFDPLAIAVTIARTDRTVRFLGKKEVFDAPIVGQLAAALGGIRVDRASGSDEPLVAAAEALERGELVALMPQGTIPRGRAFFDPVLKGRWGAARLAAMTKVPVIPVGLWGTEHVWPRSARLPAILRLSDPPTVRVRVGEPVALKHRSPDADTKRIMAAIAALLPDEARRRREPTEEELARTYPPGYRSDAGGEDARRPGTDRRVDV